MSMQSQLSARSVAPGGIQPVDTSPGVPVQRKHRRMRRMLWNNIPVATFVGLIAIWAVAVPLFHIPSYLVPSPWDTVSRIISDFPELWANTGPTVTEIVLGFAITIVVAIPLGLLVALSPLARQIVYPPIVFMQLVPKIAVAPLFVVWLGFGLQSKVLLTILMTFFPLLLASISGFRILDDRLLYLTRSMGASRWQTFRYLRFPAALPVIFSGLKTSATIAATAALVAEFVGANVGLGYILLRGTSELDTTLIFAVLAILTVIGIALNYIVELVEYFLTPWERIGNS